MVLALRKNLGSKIIIYFYFFALCMTLVDVTSTVAEDSIQARTKVKLSLASNC